MTKQRNVSIDLFRCILTCFVVAFHICFYGLGLNDMSAGNYIENQYTILMTLCEAFTVVAVNCFFMLSGYFHPKCRYSKIVDILFMTIVYSSIGYFSSTALGFSEFSIKHFGRVVLLSFKSYWFIVVYFVIYLLSDFINTGLNGMTHKQWKRFLIAFFILNTLFGFILNSRKYGSPFSVMPMLFCYSLGYYINKFGNTKKIRRRNYLWGYVIISVLIFVGGYILIKLNKQTLAHSYITSYCNPLIVLSAFCLTAYFCNGKQENTLPHSLAKLISFAGSNVLAVYLLTDSTDIRDCIYFPIITMTESNTNVFIVIVVMIVQVLILFALGTALEAARRKIFQILYNKAIKTYQSIRKQK